MLNRYTEMRFRMIQFARLHGLAEVQMDRHTGILLEMTEQHISAEYMELAMEREISHPTCSVD
jgi:hypothetical protein